MSTSLKSVLPTAVKKSIKIQRARAFELFGSARYSAPALYELDWKMLDFLAPTGVFLEVGANDGYSQSNTYYMERILGWRGILIEPLPSLYSRCVALRRKSECFNVACTSDGHGSVSMVDLDLLSVALGQQTGADERLRLGDGNDAPVVNVKAATVSDVIDASSFDHIDFMSIDVEGAELSLLRGLDFSRHAPSWLLVETQYPKLVHDLCHPALEFVATLSHHDYLFKNRNGAEAG